MQYETILLSIIGALLLALAYLVGKIMGRRSVKQDIDRERQDAIKRSRAVITGHVSEQLAPYLPDFPYNPNEVRFIGKPVDFIAFKGMDSGTISEVAFVEVKSGNAQLSSRERQLRNIIKGKKVVWEEYRKG